MNPLIYIITGVFLLIVIAGILVVRAIFKHGHIGEDLSDDIIDIN